MNLPNTPKTMVLPSFDSPDISTIPNELVDLLTLLDDKWSCEMYGKKWTFQRISEFEQRDVQKRTNNMDMITKNYIQRVEILVRTIVEIVDNKTQVVISQKDWSDAPLLGSLLLGLDPLIISDLYEAYRIGSEQLQERFRKQHPEISDVLKQSFFDWQPESSESSDSKITQTNDSGD
jgi:hypothetical protein